MSAFFAQKAITGFAALALAAAGTALPGSDAKAAPLIFDCYSRSTSDLLMKSALDLSNENLACIQTATGGQLLSLSVNEPQIIYGSSAPAPAPAPSAGGSFFGSVLGGALGSVLGTAINGGNRTTEIHHHYEQGRDKAQDTKGRVGGMHAHREVPLPGGVTPKVNVINPMLLKPIQLPSASGSSPAGKPSTGSKPSGVVLPGGTKLGGLNPSLGKPGGRLPL